jgi:glycosyltransferase involved in cell wall biosynthesis
LRIVYESQAGLSHARKKGVQESFGEFIIFCDDDNWLNSKYLSTAYKLMQSNPEIGVLAGRGEAVSDIELPYWFNTYQGAYAVGVLALNSGDITNNKWVWGAGMTIRKQVFLNLLHAGFSHITLDRVKENLSSGGDNEICYWHILGGYKLWYDENLSFKHWMPANRLTKEYYLKLKSAQNISSQALNIYIRHINAKFYHASKTSKISLIKIIPWVLKYLLKISKDVRVFYLYPKLSFMLDREDIKIYNMMKKFSKTK